MAERPEDLNLPNAVVTRIIKDAVSEIIFLETAYLAFKTEKQCVPNEKCSSMFLSFYAGTITCAMCSLMVE